MEEGPQTDRAAGMGVLVMLMTPLLALTVLLLWFVGARIILRPAAIRQEVYRPSVPLDGPITARELKQAESSVEGFVPREKLDAGLSQQEIERIVEVRRETERIRKSSWERKRGERLREAEARRPAGWVLVGLGFALAGVWSWWLWGMRKSFSGRVDGLVSGQ